MSSTFFLIQARSKVPIPSGQPKNAEGQSRLSCLPMLHISDRIDSCTRWQAVNNEARLSAGMDTGRGGTFLMGWQGILYILSFMTLEGPKRKKTIELRLMSQNRVCTHRHSANVLSNKCSNGKLYTYPVRFLHTLSHRDLRPALPDGKAYCNLMIPRKSSVFWV